MQALCEEAAKERVVLVAAAHNEGIDSFPAALPEVIGVQGADEVRGPYGYYYRADQAVECAARGDLQRVCWADRREIMQRGNSFAAPHIAGIVALLREVQPQAPLAAVRAALAANALEEDSAVRGGEAAEVSAPGALDWLRRAALYPFNKEMHALVRFRALAPFEIVGVADPVGKDAATVLGAAPMGVEISARIELAAKRGPTPWSSAMSISWGVLPKGTCCASASRRPSTAACTCSVSGRCGPSTMAICTSGRRRKG